jgi:acetyltransferase-like isoleucine patch superfamily enzyme
MPSPSASRNIFAHPTAVIAQGATIGSGTKIWHFSHVREGAKIGRDCVIGQNVYIDTNVRIGNGVKIQNGVSIYEGVILEDGVFVGPAVTFTNDPYPRSFPNGWKKTPTRVKKGASLGANATIMCGVKIGRYAMVGAGAVVTNDVPPFALVRSLPATVVGRVTTMGRPCSSREWSNRRHRK